MNNYRIGQYAEYQGNQFMVVSLNGNIVKLNSPTLGRRQVKHTNVKLANVKQSARVIMYAGNKYIVTAKGMIFSVKTGRIMKWDDTNGDRKRLLERYKETMDNELDGD